MTLERENEAKEVPLTEQLRSVPKDYKAVRAIQWAEDGRETGHQFIPVGFMLHRAADEIERLRAELAALRSLPQTRPATEDEIIKLYITTPINPDRRSDSRLFIEAFRAAERFHRIEELPRRNDS